MRRVEVAGVGLTPARVTSGRHHAPRLADRRARFPAIDRQAATPLPSGRGRPLHRRGGRGFRGRRPLVRSATPPMSLVWTMPSALRACFAEVLHRLCRLGANFPSTAILYPPRWCTLTHHARLRRRPRARFVIRLRHHSACHRRGGSSFGGRSRRRGDRGRHAADGRGCRGRCDAGNCGARCWDSRAGRGLRCVATAADQTERDRAGEDERDFATHHATKRRWLVTSSKVARVAERISTGLREHAQSVRPSRHFDAGSELTGRGIEGVHLGVVAA